MTTIDRHIIRRLVVGYVFLVVALIAFFILLHYLEYIDDFMDRGATMRTIFTVYYPSYIPEIIRLTSPLALFLSCVYLTGKLAQTMQVMALQTSGVSLFRLMRPYVLVGLGITGIMIWFNGWIVPVTNQTVLEFDRQHLNDAPRQLDVTNIHRQDSPNGFVTVGYFDRQGLIAHRISLQRFGDAGRLTERVDASSMEWQAASGLWRVYDAVVYRFPPGGPLQRREIAAFDTMLQVFPRDIARTERDVESMTVPVAAEYVASLRRSGAGGLGRPLVGYYVKFAYPFANLIVLLLGVPLAAVRRRGGQAMQIALGLATAFAYLAVQKLTEPFGYSGELPPLVVAWTPHVLFFGLALLLLWRARK